MKDFLPRISSVLYMALFLASIAAGAVGTAVAMEELKSQAVAPEAPAPAKKPTRIRYRHLS